MTLIIEPKTSNYYKAVEKCARYKFLSRSRFCSLLFLAAQLHLAREKLPQLLLLLDGLQL